MSTLRISNIEAKSVPASATIDEKVKITNSSGDVLVFLDGKTSGITTVGINTTDGNITFDANSNVVVTGIITATKFVGTIEPTNLTVGGDLTIPDKIIHSGDTNTSLRFPSADTVTIETAGSERLRITSGGNILKGLTSPRAQFFHSVVNPIVQIEGTGDFERQVSITSSSSNANWGAVQILAHQRSNTIGGNTALQAGDQIGLISYQGHDGTNFIEGSRVEANVETGIGGNDMPTDLRFYTNGGTTSTTERLRITSTGALLLGTTTHSNVENLHIHTASTNKAIIKFTNTTTGQGTGDGFEFGLNSNEDVELMLKEDKNIIFGTGATLAERLRITSTGLVDIFGSASQSTYTPLLLQNSAAAGTGSNPDIVKLAFGSSGFTKASIRAAVYGEGFMTFHTNNDTEKLRITSGGNVSITDGNLVVASGHGIDFSATADAPLTGASMSNELLDDYEEGSFTPSGFCDGGSVTNQSCKYTKIGKCVFIYLYVSNINIPNTACQWKLYGLPFTVSTSHYPALAVGYSGSANLPAEIRFLCRANTNWIYSHSTAGTASYLTNQGMRAYIQGQELVVTGYYFTDS